MKKQQKKKQTAGIRKILKLKPTCFSAMALLILLVLAFQVWHRDENPLLKKNNSITLYREVYEGQMPEFRTEVFFPNNHFDYEKVTYDTSALDVNTPGDVYGSGAVRRRSHQLRGGGDGESLRNG